MDFVTILLVGAALYLWYRVQALTERMQAEEQARVRVQQELAILRLELESGARPASTSAAAPTTMPIASAPPAGPAARWHPLAAGWRALGPGGRPSSPARKPSQALPAAPARAAKPAGAAKSVRVAAPLPAARPDPTPQPMPDGAQAAFGLDPPPRRRAAHPDDQLLARLGLAPADDGAVSPALPSRPGSKDGAGRRRWHRPTLGAAFPEPRLQPWLDHRTDARSHRTWGGLRRDRARRARVPQGEGILGHVLLAVGLSVVSLSLFAATRLFGDPA